MLLQMKHEATGEKETNRIKCVRRRHRPSSATIKVADVGARKKIFSRQQNEKKQKKDKVPDGNVCKSY